MHAGADNLEVPETNVTPVAVARVLGDERLMPSFSFSGAALELTLDASMSHDLDGSIAMRARSPTSSTTPDASNPRYFGDSSGLPPARYPARTFQSSAFTLDAATLTRT